MCSQATCPNLSPWDTCLNLIAFPKTKVKGGTFQRIPLRAHPQAQKGIAVQAVQFGAGWGGMEVPLAPTWLGP